MATTSYAAFHESSTSPNEANLIVYTRRSDLEAFNQLVLLNQDRIYNLAARILGNHDLAEDITQNTFLSAHLNLLRFRNGSFLC